MYIRRNLITSAIFAVGLLSTTAAQATLESRLNGLATYDSALNVTWLTNANLAATNTFGVSGIDAGGAMSWNTAQSWIGAMNATNYLGYSDWRLPTTGPVNGTSMNYSNSNIGTADYGYNISAVGTLYAGSKGSEMAYLYYSNLGNKGYCNSATSTVTDCVSQTGYGLANTGPFINMKSHFYWSGTEYAPNTDSAFTFSPFDGYQGAYGKSDHNYVLALRSGDVTAVPEPEAWAMMLMGLALAGAVARRRRQ